MPMRLRKSDGSTPPALTITAWLFTLTIAPSCSIATDCASICLTFDFSITLSNVAVGTNTVGVSTYFGYSAATAQSASNQYGNYSTFTGTFASPVAAVAAKGTPVAPRFTAEEKKRLSEKMETARSMDRLLVIRFDTGQTSLSRAAVVWNAK